jgi:hypothetical protein
MPIGSNSFSWAYSPAGTPTAPSMIPERIMASPLEYTHVLPGSSATGRAMAYSSSFGLSPIWVTSDDSTEPGS